MWKPDKTKVSDKEIVGRRVFGKKIFRAPRERGLFVPDIFFETRLENDLYFDRLGLKTVDKEVVTFLTPQCQQHGDMQHKKLVGWAAIKVSYLKITMFRIINCLFQYPNHKLSSSIEGCFHPTGVDRFDQVFSRSPQFEKISAKIEKRGITLVPDKSRLSIGERAIVQLEKAGTVDRTLLQQRVGSES
jgi:hypothetical protein